MGVNYHTNGTISVHLDTDPYEFKEKLYSASLLLETPGDTKESPVKEAACREKNRPARYGGAFVHP